MSLESEASLDNCVQNLCKVAIFIIAGYRESISITMGYNDVKTNTERCWERLQHDLPKWFDLWNVGAALLEVTVSGPRGLDLEYSKAASDKQMYHSVIGKLITHACPNAPSEFNLSHNWKEAALDCKLA